ncbi:endonuclease domain-containing protein [Streptomyces bobili]
MRSPQSRWQPAHPDRHGLEDHLSCLCGLEPAPLPPGTVGAAYVRVREHGPSAANFLCADCETARRATDWDDCHAHGLIRGPLCGSCSTVEGQGKEFLARPGPAACSTCCNATTAVPSAVCRRPTTGSPNYAATCTWSGVPRTVTGPCTCR